jgi:outer membrane biosynthesis protein TonB
MLAKSTWLNREKLIFFLTTVCLAGAAGYSVFSEPEQIVPGGHRMPQHVPQAIEINLDTRFESERYAANPFTPYRKPRPKEPVKPVKPLPGPKPPEVHKPPKPPKPPRPPRPPTPAPKPAPRPTAPKPYEVPVNFKGVVGTGDGKLYVLLKTKDSLENRYLSEGDIWPETGLTIVRITHTSVLLQNQKGERFLMRDLYAKKPRAGVTGAGS